MTPTAAAFAAVQDWQTGRTTAEEATTRILAAADGDPDTAVALMGAATRMWVEVAASAATPHRGGLFGEPIGPAHGRARETARSAA